MEDRQVGFVPSMAVLMSLLPCVNPMAIMLVTVMVPYMMLFDFMCKVSVDVRSTVAIAFSDLPDESRPSIAGN